MAKQKPLQLVGAINAGPLFVIIVERAPVNYGTRIQGIRRRNHERQATPAWADRAAIRAAYNEAKRLTAETGIVHSVDHIVPLRSEIVCGLHWHMNFRVIPLSDNSSKANRHWPDMPFQQMELI